MKKVILITLIGIAFIACNSPEKRKSGAKEVITIDASTVYVFYFHGKQRCKTCNAVEAIARETVEKNFAENPKALFREIEISEKGGEALVEKYEVAWNALIIAKGDEYENITEQAFATALSRPEKLEEEIKSLVNKYLRED